MTDTLLDENDPQVIEDVSNQLKISPAVVEKDVYVTQALRALADLTDDCFYLVFQGGTCLSKAHRVIQRMSEDCDFRIISKSSLQNFSKERQRKQLRVFRRKILTALEAGGFLIQPERVSARNQGRFMAVFLDYPAIFPPSLTLRPQIKLEFMGIGIKTTPQTLSITSLVHQLIGSRINQKEKALLCVSLIETAVEKWVALTRRVSNIERGYQVHDSTLIRHLYDLCMLYQRQSFGDEYYKMISSVVMDDRHRYKNQNPEYVMNSMQEIEFALSQLKQSKIWHQDWDQFIASMVFRQEAPSYDEAMAVLNTISESALFGLQLVVT